MLAFDLFQKTKSRKKEKKVTHTKPNKTEMNPIKNKSVAFQSKPNLFNPNQAITNHTIHIQIIPKPNKTYRNQTESYQTKPNQTDTH